VGAGGEGRTKVIYRNGVSRTGRSPRLMLTSSSLSSSSSSSSSLSCRPPSSPSRLHRPFRAAYDTQTRKFHRAGNYVSRGLNFRLGPSTGGRGGWRGVNASAPRAADRRRASRRAGAAKWLVMLACAYFPRRVVNLYHLLRVSIRPCLTFPTAAQTPSMSSTQSTRVVRRARSESYLFNAPCCESDYRFDCDRKSATQLRNQGTLLSDFEN